LILLCALDETDDFLEDAFEDLATDFLTYFLTLADPAFTLLATFLTLALNLEITEDNLGDLAINLLIILFALDEPAFACLTSFLIVNLTFGETDESFGGANKLLTVLPTVDTVFVALLYKSATLNVLLPDFLNFLSCFLAL
jgi:hypothetical protein